MPSVYNPSVDQEKKMVHDDIVDTGLNDQRIVVVGGHARRARPKSDVANDYVMRPNLKGALHIAGRNLQSDTMR